MAIAAEEIKKLRQMTGAGIMACKKSLEAADGNIDEAVKDLRKKGAKIAAKKGTRATSEGIIGEYIHFNKKVGAMAEVNCETDFVARNENFVEFAHEIAIHVTANNPRWLSAKDVPEDILDSEREIFKEQLKKENKPENIIDKIIKGKLNKFYEKNCLLNQLYSGDDSITVEQAVKDLIAKTGENIQIARFARFAVGEE